jgi:hypothetical protein
MVLGCAPWRNRAVSAKCSKRRRIESRNCIQYQRLIIMACATAGMAQSASPTINMTSNMSLYIEYSNQ